ncbi:MAG TPA: hypothetical protein PKD20_01830 [Candidatus Saccharibacteria bacterium]|jgi:hypothetical protein|nr:hypothetical protein [Candidatus Saccharibacteria bacterium]HMT55598.1 hypothetical protein [Candidatus Saccharibacteria bacterium]
MLHRDSRVNTSALEDKALEHQMNNDTLETNSRFKSVKSKAKEFGRFLIYRQTSYVEWGSGILAGNTMAELGLNRSAASVLVMLGVGSTEYLQTKYERSKIKDKPTLVSKHKGLHELSAFMQSLWTGAPAVMKYNSANGLDNTPRRNLIHSLAYGAATGYWSSNIWMAPEARDFALDKAHEFIESPVTTGLGALAIAAGVFGIYEGLERIKSRPEHEK